MAASGTGGGRWRRRQQEPARVREIWDGYSNRNRRWARRTSECESGGDPNAIGGGGMYRGAFQFMRSTWRHSPKSPGGDPIDYPWRTQAVVAVALKKRDGSQALARSAPRAPRPRTAMPRRLETT